MQPNATKWTVTLEQDPETGELILPFPVDLLSQMGWSEGTDLFWIENNNGSFTLTDKKPAESKIVQAADDDVGC